MQMITNSDNIVIGSRVFFIERRTPHTGYVSEIYDHKDQKMYVVKDVSFIDDFYDNDSYEVLQEAIYKTDKIYLPKYPKPDERIYTFGVMHSCGKDDILLATDYPKFFKYYKNKTLFSNDVNKYHPRSGNYISFDNNTFIYLKNGNGPYKVIHFTNNGIRYYLLAKLYKKHFIPSEVLIPEWKDPLRSFPITDESIKLIQSVINKMYPDTVVPALVKRDLNEYDISAVYHLNNDVIHTYFKDEYEIDPAKLFTLRNNKITLNLKYFDQRL